MRGLVQILAVGSILLILLRAGGLKLRFVRFSGQALTQGVLSP
jgi:hypothetical protein